MRLGRRAYLLTRHFARGSPHPYTQPNLHQLLGPLFSAFPSDTRRGSAPIRGKSDLFRPTNTLALKRLETLFPRQEGINERKWKFQGERSIITSANRRRKPRSSAVGVGVGVQKKVWRRVNKRGFSTQTGEKKEVIGWREALKSPRKASQYAGQLRRSAVEWAKHMWTGAKLLAADVRGSWKILKRITQGKQISRRERNFIVQTGVDLARLVPFSLFLIIPAAEFALPFALKLFPNMLPSQFHDQMKKEDDMRRNLKVRLELAKYLRDVVEERAKVLKSSSTVDTEIKRDAEDLSAFLGAIRNGKEVDPRDVPRFARLFSDEITIEGAVRPQLVAMCKYMRISPYGTDQFLRFKIRSRLNRIKNDDMQIMWEGGVQSLTHDEVIKACRDRGIRTAGSSSRMLRRQLSEWLELSQDKEIPGSLLIMSRAFFYLGEEGVKETLGSLPDDVLEDVKKAAGGEEITNEDRLEEARRQEKLIAIEKEREARKEKEAAEAAEKKARESQETLSATETSPVESISDAAEAEEAAAAEKEVLREVFGVKSESESLRDTTPGAKPAESIRDGIPAGSEVPTTAGVPAEGVETAGEEEREKQREAVLHVAESLGDLSSESAVEKERLALEELKAELVDAEVARSNMGEKKGADLKRFEAMVRKLDEEVEKVDREVGRKMKLLDKDNDGLMSLDEAAQVLNTVAGEKNEWAVAECLRRLDADKDGLFSKEDIRRVLRDLQNTEASESGDKLNSETSPPHPVSRKINKTSSNNNSEEKSSTESAAKVVHASATESK